VGGLDGDFKMYFEDIDLCWRMGLRGYRIGYAPAAVVYHAGQGSSKKSFFPWNYFRARRNRVWAYFKNAGPLVLAVFVPSHLILTILRIPVHFLTGRIGRGLAEVAALAAAVFHLGIALSKRSAIQAARRASDGDLARRGFLRLPFARLFG
jgi:GT2 family glycosyltransferase